MSVVTDSRESDEGAGHQPARVTLRFEPSGTAVRVPPGVTVFDAASWNGIAIDSTCGGHGTCKKCRVRICDGSVPVSPLDTRAFDEGELEDGWRLACRAETGDALVIEVPPLVTRPKAATAGVGRQVILRPALQKRYLELVGTPTRRSAHRLRACQGCSRRSRAPRRDRRAAPPAERLAIIRLAGDRRHRRRPPDRRRGRRHDRPAAGNRLRPRHDDSRGDAARPRYRNAPGGQVDAQPPAAVRRRRHLAYLGDDARPDRSRAPDAPRTRHDARACRGGLRSGGDRPLGRVRDRARRERDDDRDRARGRPRAGRRGAVHHGGAIVPRHAGVGARPAPAPAGPCDDLPRSRRRTSAATSSRVFSRRE